MTDHTLPADPPTPKRRGYWKPGQSGNPKGRPAGSRNRHLAALDALGDRNATQLVKTAIAEAKAGNARLLIALLDRVWPARRGGRMLSVALPTITSVADVATAACEVTAAVGRGDITVDDGAALIGLFDAVRKAFETTEIEARLKALEECAENDDES